MNPPAQQTGIKAIPPAVNALSPEFLEAEYDRYKKDPASMPSDLRAFFQGFDLAMAGPMAGSKSAAQTPASATANSSGGCVGRASPFQNAVATLIQCYRDLGHLAAKLDPFGRPRPRPTSLDLASHGLSDQDLSREVETDIAWRSQSMTLAKAIAAMEATFCGSLGIEFSHIQSVEQRRWFRERLESSPEGEPIEAAARMRALQLMLEAQTFEEFLAKRYQSAKRFSLEGGESLIPLLAEVVETLGAKGTVEVVLAMAHRGRLNVLKNIMNKDIERIITEFEDAKFSDRTSDGDVKYHRGYSGEHPLPQGGKVHLSLLNNPSHLEAVNALAIGRCRARQDLDGDTERTRCVPLLIHGDAAIAGQGVVAECLNMAYLEGYTVGGTIHVVINNLVGFTTEPSDGRSTTYCTDVAKMIEAPVIHVNGMDPDAVIRAARLAADYRQTFHKDVFIDIVCYRKYGHNEQDEAAYTQPILTKLITEVVPPAKQYAARLIAEGIVTDADITRIVDTEFAKLDVAQVNAKADPVYPVPPPFTGEWAGFTGQYSFESPVTAISLAQISKICKALGTVPEGFTAHRKLKGLLESRAAIANAKNDALSLSHADAELLSFGSLLLDGVPVRVSGQDVRRGTFTSRHAVLCDEQTGERTTPLNAIAPGKQANLMVWDSPLSEYAVMGFDYGYSRGAPRSLVLWEAQFGDFVNGAQIILDQFLASSESKWDRWAGLVLLLPHGYEGQGPEHSSARLERFLQLCAQDNMEVCYPTTGGQVFHMLRRQALRNFRKPLIVMTPKKFLRELTGTLDEVTKGSFQHVLDDPAFVSGKLARKVCSTVIYCSGKIFHEMNVRREQIARTDTAVIRIEQLYPLNVEKLRAIDAQYPASARRVWVQEEPRNQGAYIFISDMFRTKLAIDLGYIGRSAAASPAVGSLNVHKAKQEQILTEALPPTGTQAPINEAKPAPGAAPKDSGTRDTANKDSGTTNSGSKDTGSKGRTPSRAQ